ncbi:thermonuclease family protein [Micrococcus sp.]|uniref:thermonuclease family protein n=1 Tax=Micrococcus sp. TaxID=1271 RepID=UPI0026DD305A|nr:thermonuclease family protein [Micrococcus sp.]MDO4239792.1 thermonuclease family protein [Micrococcus sp.]
MRVVDGDTVEVERDGAPVTVRLLNVDTPETKHPNKAVQCLGPEATDLLESLLEPGDRVVLQYDQERTDRYGRTLAGVFEGDDLVNAEIARAGLGAPVVFEPNRRFYPEVRAAWEEAERAEVGLHQPRLDCSLSLLAAPAALGQEPPASPAPVTEPAALGGMIASAQATATAVGLVEEAVRAAGETDHAWMGVAYAAETPRVKETLSRYAGADAHITRLREAQTRLQAEASAAQERRAAQERAEEQAAEEREQEARAGEQRAEQQAAERAGQERAARESEEEAESSSDGDDSSTSGGSSGTGEIYGCEAAWAAGVAPLAAGSRHYHPAMDTDSDGVACELAEGSSGGSSTSGDSTSRGFADTSGSGGAGGPVSGSDGVCPDGYPVKVSGSGKYHLPGGRWYDDTGAKRCYSSASAAEADGAVAAKG